MDIQQLIDQYTSWLRSEITFKRFGEYFEITTPYLDNANDYIQIYVCQRDNKIIFSDDSYIIHNLIAHGVKFTKTRKNQLIQTLLQYGVELNGDELILEAPVSEFPQKKHLFIQAMLRTDDLFALSKSNVASVFLDDVIDFFKENEIYYTDNVQFRGKSGFTHSYDFLLQRSRNRPERLCQVINNPSRSNISNILFSWNDTSKVRNNNTQLIVFINDQNPINEGFSNAFINYGTKVILWKNRYEKQNLELLSV